MSSLEEQLAGEIKKVQAEIDAQKQIIKRSIGNTMMIHAAEQNLKALRTRMGVLETNQKKMQAAGSLF